MWFCSGSCGSDIIWVVIVLVVMERISWYINVDGDEDSCCNPNGGICD